MDVLLVNYFGFVKVENMSVFFGWLFGVEGLFGLYFIL